MQFIYLNTKKQLRDYIMEQNERNNLLKSNRDYWRKQFEITLNESQEKQSAIEALESEVFYLTEQLEHEKNATNGYKKVYFKELEEKEKSVKPIKITVNGRKSDVCKMILYKTAPKETHKCTKECLNEHVLPAIQRDYDSISLEYKSYNETVNKFLDHWEERLNENYDFIECLSIGNGKIEVYFNK